MDCGTPGFPVLHIPRVCSNSCPLSQWCHPTISSFVIPFFYPQSFPASGSFPMSWLFTSGGQSIGVFSISPSNEYSGLISFRIDWFDLLAVQGTLKILKISNVNSTFNLNSLPGNVAYSQILGTRTWTSLGEPPSCLSKWVFYICNIYVIYIH